MPESIKWVTTSTKLVSTSTSGVIPNRQNVARQLYVGDGAETLDQKVGLESGGGLLGNLGELLKLERHGVEHVEHVAFRESESAAERLGLFGSVVSNQLINCFFFIPKRMK